MHDFTHSTIKTLTLDVTHDEDIKRVVDHVIEAEGHIDILVNNAGIFITRFVQSPPTSRTTH